MLGTLLKVGDLLDLFDDDHPEWGVSEVAKALDMCKSSAHSFLSTLDHIGLLQRTAESRYRLGWRVFHLNHTLLAKSELQAEAQPLMEELADRFGENVSLAVLEGDHVVFIRRLQGMRVEAPADSSTFSIAFPSYCCASGKVLLADRQWAEVEARLRRCPSLQGLTPNSITTVDGLKWELEQVRNQKCAYNFEESVLGVCGVAAPVRNHRGTVIAAMSISATVYHFSQFRERFRAAIMDAARQVSENLGYFGPGSHSQSHRK